MKPAVTIIGTGAVGSALQDFFRRNDYRVTSLWNSREGHVFGDSSSPQLIAGQSTPSTNPQVGELLFITVPDDQIEVVARKLAGSEINWKNRRVVHCSGSLASDVLRLIAEQGAGVASMHPVQTFSLTDSAARFSGITISLEGDNEVTSFLAKMVDEMQAVALPLDKSQKQMVHIAAVFASNYLVALLGTVDELLSTEGIDNGLEMLKPLIRQTVENVLSKGPGDALTGPVARGDLKTVEQHQARLSSAHRTLYDELGLRALRLAQTSGRLSEEQVRRLHSLLSNG